MDDLRGFRVDDVAGRTVGVVECPMYGSHPDEADALAVRAGRVFRRHFIVPLTAVAEVDLHAGVLALAATRGSLQRFF